MCAQKFSPSREVNANTNDLFSYLNLIPVVSDESDAAKNDLELHNSGRHGKPSCRLLFADDGDDEIGNNCSPDNNADEPQSMRSNQSNVSSDERNKKLRSLLKPFPLSQVFSNISSPVASSQNGCEGTLTSNGFDLSCVKSEKNSPLGRFQRYSKVDEIDQCQSNFLEKSELSFPTVKDDAPFSNRIKKRCTTPEAKDVLPLPNRSEANAISSHVLPVLSSPSTLNCFRFDNSSKSCLSQFLRQIAQASPSERSGLGCIYHILLQTLWLCCLMWLDWVTRLEKILLRW